MALESRIDRDEEWRRLCECLRAAQEAKTRFIANISAEWSSWHRRSPRVLDESQTRRADALQLVVDELDLEMRRFIADEVTASGCATATGGKE